jgi:hypothetical protein
MYTGIFAKSVEAAAGEGFKAPARVIQARTGQYNPWTHERILMTRFAMSLPAHANFPGAVREGQSAGPADLP